MSTSLAALLAPFPNVQPACRGSKDGLWFPVGGSLQVARADREAKAICGGCPIRMACLDFAISNEMEYGTFGGYTAAERAELAERAEQYTQPRAKARRGRAPISANELNRRAEAYEQGHPDAEIAELVGASVETIMRWRQKSKLGPPHHRHEPGSRVGVCSTPGDRLADHRRGCTDEEMAERDGVSVSSVIRWRSRNGLAANGPLENERASHLRSDEGRSS